MSKTMPNEYHPDVVLPPGETLAETIEAIGMTQVDLAERTGHAPKTINEIIQGKAALTAETALQLERVLGVPASFWNNLEHNYRDALARRREERDLSTQASWLGNFPLKAMAKRGWLELRKDAIETGKQVLNFFGVASKELWDEKWLAADALFRKSPAFESSPYAVAAWLRRGELEAQRVGCKHFEEAKFRAALLRIRGLTAEQPTGAIEEAADLCARTGVAFVVVPELPGTCVSGAARWLTPRKALIQLSTRYKTDDQFWFSFFHEAAHLLQGGKRKAFVDRDSETGKSEQAADSFAARTLIPSQDLKEFLKDANEPFISRASVERFARRIGIAPGVVVGRLQREGELDRRNLNGLKRRINPDDCLVGVKG